MDIYLARKIKKYIYRHDKSLHQQKYVYVLKELQAHTHNILTFSDILLMYNFPFKFIIEKTKIDKKYYWIYTLQEF